MIATMGRLGRAAGYILVALALLAGIPWACIRYVGWPLPTTIPDGVALRAWFDDPFTPNRFWSAMSIVGWLLWAVLVFSIVAEMLDRFSRIRLPRLRLVTPMRSLAGGLVGAITAPAVAHAAPPPVAQPAATPNVAIRADPATPATSGGSYTVTRGDRLSGIAQRFLGDRDAYPRIAVLNPDLEVRDHRFPDHIEPGWRLTLPADAADRGIRAHAAGSYRPPAPRPDRSVAPAASVPEPAVPTPAATTDPAAAPIAPAPAPGNLDGDGDGHPDVAVGESSHAAMAGAGLLASLLFALLTSERRRQRGLYGAGQEPPRPADGRAERELRVAQQPADVERLDAALRNLGNGLAERAHLPDIVGVRLIGADVQVLLGQPANDPPPPWLDEATQWVLPGYVGTPAAPSTTRALLPMLVTIGSRAGRHLLIDLERLGTLSISGHPYRARDLLRHIACELACNTWSDGATIILAGFGSEAETLADIGPDRMTIAHTPNEAITAIRAELTRRTEHGLDTPPLILLVADPDTTTRAALADIQDALTRTGRCGIAIVATVPDAATIGAAAISITEAGQLTVDLPGLRQTTDAAIMPVDMLEPMAAVFRVAHLAPTIEPDPAAPDLPAWDDVVEPALDVLPLFEPTVADDRVFAVEPPPGPRETQSAPHDQLDADLDAWYDGTNTPPRIAILGPIQTRTPGVLTDSRHRLYTEILLYLLTRPRRRATRVDIENALWYGHPAGETTVRKAMSKLRKWLGNRDDGTNWIPANADNEGVYEIQSGILLDWHLLLELRRRAAAQGSDGITDLRAALALIRGPAMHDMPDRKPYRRPYTWIGDSDIAPGRIISTVADVAHRVAEYHLAHGDTATARWAIDQAWLADPERSVDDLWHDRMRCDQHDRNAIALQQLLDEYLDAREAEVPEDLPTHIYKRMRDILSDL